MYKEERDIRWDETFNKRITISANGKRAQHSIGGVFYAPIRTKRGYTRGNDHFKFSSNEIGKHYWEIKYVDCTLDGYNTYVGISERNLDEEDHLGSSSSL